MFIFSKIYYDGLFQYSKLSDACAAFTSQIHASAMLMLLIVGS